MKDFDKWHVNKKGVNQNERPFFHEREIWFAHLGINIGFEQDGSGKNYLRPIIIYKKFNNEIFWGIPLTRTNRTNQYYFQLDSEKEKSSKAILSQVRLFDAKRLSYKTRTISEEEFEILNEKFKALLP
jgi:mRNA-degrading endonuclease toxin of MazEF toxin-antitoxin module